MPRPSTPASAAHPSVRPDATGHLPPKKVNPYPDIPLDEGPGLVGGPATVSIPGSAHDDPLDPLGKGEKRIVVSLPADTENHGGEEILSGRPRETGGERP